MNFDKSLLSKNFFRFTGPPENWLTAIKYMTWGLEEKYKERWANIQTGDIFFMHSTSTGSRFTNIKASIIGLGVVGTNFSIKKIPLWIEEVEDKKNKWPLLIPFSEIYLFSEIPAPITWEAPNETNLKKIDPLIQQLLSKAVPLASIIGFPQMGSISSVSENVVKQIFDNNSDLYLVGEQKVDLETKTTPFVEIKDASESLRYAATLQPFNSVSKRVINKAKSTFTKDNELLSRAEESHANTLQELISFFRSKGYDTYQNRFVDLYAVNNKQGFLSEVKSTENRNFRSQARKAIVQLFEYEFFEIKKFVSEKGLDKINNFRILVPSQKPTDLEYVNFINYLKTDVGVLNNHKLEAVGISNGIDKI